MLVPSIRASVAGVPDGGLPALLQNYSEALERIDALPSPNRQPTRRGKPARPALTAVRNELMEGPPASWSDRERARVAAAVLFATGLARTFKGEEQTMRRLLLAARR
jgi:hypothetical protein